ncbi:MAG TPA: MBL fold metallo-hydrolase [Actinomycetota bacterium]|nr:MBL fold metallo-hydrolase [Actinomycetota bacterium]
MWLDVFDRNPYGTNCWLIAAEDADEAVVVDPGFEPAAVRALLSAAGKRPSAVLLTHAHADHAMEAGAFAGEDLPVYIHPADAVAFDDPDAWSRGNGTPLTPVKDLRTFEDGDVVRLGGGVSVEVIHTPGHTPGSCCFRVEADVLVFSGDLVFAGTVGRSDFANSDPAAMQRSLERFLTLPDDLEVLPGHGPRTTVARERATNPFLVGIG